MSEPDRWELGSEFHWFQPGSSLSRSRVTPWAGNGLTFGTGRAALRALLRKGTSEFRWRRLLVPSFLCQEVISAVASEGLTVQTYFDDPRLPIEAPSPGEEGAVLVVNTFGVRPRWVRPAGFFGTVIEDHTHDPWSNWAWTSDADYCFASLRKTLPMPDGAMLWSPSRVPLPSPASLTATHRDAVLRKLEAMLLKGLFLKGYPVEKQHFRRLAISGEDAIASDDVSDMHSVSRALAEGFPVMAWREQRRMNHARLLSSLAIEGLQFVIGNEVDACPFSAVLLCSDAPTRERLRVGLTERRIYPAVLWHLENSVISIPEESLALSRRVISLHCDGRYGTNDMERVADAVAEIMQ